MLVPGCGPDFAWVPTNAGNQCCGSTVCFVQNVGADYSLKVGNNRSKCFRFETHQGDFVGGQTDRQRSELQFATKYDFDRDIWLAWQIRVNVTPAILSDYIVLGQLHQSEDAGDFSGYPPVAFDLHSDGLYISTATDALASDPNPYAKTYQASALPFAQNVAHDVITRAKIDWTGNALLQVWIDGQQVVNVSGTSIGMNDAVGPYLKIGAYFGPETAAQTVVAEYFNIVEGYDDLSSRISNPPRLPF